MKVSLINSVFFGRGTFLFFLLLQSCQNEVPVPHAEYIGSYAIEPNKLVSGTVLGGISGIDYDYEKSNFYLISDDRSNHAPSRLYQSKMDINDTDIASLSFERVIELSDDKGLPYEKEGCDMESIRYLSSKEQFVISDEGGKKGHPGIRFYNTYGRMNGELQLDKAYLNNLRSNKSFESLSISSNGKSLFYATEAPLDSDGEVASTTQVARIRIMESNIKSGETIGEWNYFLEKVPQRKSVKPPWGGVGSDNGLSELISLGRGRFIALERSGAYQKDKSFEYRCRVYYVYPDKEITFKNKIMWTTRKSLLIDFSKIPGGNSNVEGVCFGPEIDGQKSLLFVSDNNFSQGLSTNLYLFKIKGIE